MENKFKILKNDTWVGFSGYRYHWSNTNSLNSEVLNKNLNKDNFKNYILRKIPQEWKNYDVVLGEEILVNNLKISKIIKHGKKIFLKNPKYFFKKYQNIKLQFEVFHGEGVLDKAIDLLDDQNRNDFRDFVNKKNSFNRENLFFCKSKN